MKSYKLIHQLISLVEILEVDNQEAELSLQDFAGFLISHLEESGNDTENSDIRFGTNEKYAQSMAFQLDNNISRLFVYMSRYAKSYIKKALADTALQTAEDFTALAILLTHDSLSKGELIAYNLQEKASGSEVIRRLIAGELVDQWADTNDRRGKRIAITQKGRELLYTVFIDMGYVGKMVTGKLTFSEKLSLQYLLQKLESFHYPIHEGKSISTKADMRLWTENSKF